MSRFLLAVSAVVVLLSAPDYAGGQIPPQVPVSEPRALDTPSDDGSSVTLEWEAERNVPVMIMRSTVELGPYDVVGEADAVEGSYKDVGVEEGAEYYYSC